MSQRELFDADRTTPTQCVLCRTVRHPGEQKATPCPVDQSRAQGTWVPRPPNCLNWPQPEHDPLPEGY